MRLQSAIFDMDGTLLDSMPIWDEIGPRTLRAQGIEPEPGLHDKLKVMTFREGAQYCKDTYQLPQTVEQVMDMTKAQVKDFYNHQVEAKPGLKKFLSLLKMEGVWMYVATNTDRDLAEAGLKHAAAEGKQEGHRGIRGLPPRHPDGQVRRVPGMRRLRPLRRGGPAGDSAHCGLLYPLL